MTKLELQLEYLRVEQLPQIVQLDQLCLGGLWSLAGYERELANQHSTTLVLSLLQPENVIGIGNFWAILEEAHITLLAIHPDYQGHGLGKLVLYFLLQQAQRQKLERATLEVKESNQKALALYQQFGFKMAGKRKGYYQKTNEDALILWRGDLAKPEFQQQLLIWETEIESRLARENWTVKLKTN